MADRDMVNHPSHYETGKFECIDVMLETQGYLATLGFCICNMFKYTYRHGSKNGREDIEKAGWYRDKYLELLNRREEFIGSEKDMWEDLSKMLPDALELPTSISEPPSVPDGMCAVKDIPEMEKDFSKYMNPPVEEGYSYDDSCDFKPRVNPDKDGWHDMEHICMLEGYRPMDDSIVVPADKCLETVLDNGASLLWHHGEDIIHIGRHIHRDNLRTFRIFDINRAQYKVIKARLIDIPESCEGGNE